MSKVQNTEIIVKTDGKTILMNALPRGKIIHLMLKIGPQGNVNKIGWNEENI